MKKIIAHILLLLLLYGCQGQKGDLQKGIAAYQQSDYQTALIELEPLAEAGNAQAQFYVATLFLNGWGVDANLTTAFNYYKESAAQDYLESQHITGAMYYLGWGTEKNHQKALKHFMPAAMAGDVDSQFHVGLIYFEGSAGEQDYVKAYRWFGVSAKQGKPLSVAFQAQAKEQLTEDELQESDIFIADFTANP